MIEQEKSRVEQKIVQEIARTEEDIDRLSEVTGPVKPDNAIGRISRMEAISARKVNEAALQQARQRLAGLKSALATIDEPEFGSCLECGEQIPIARILLMPHTKYCVPCAETLE